VKPGKRHKVISVYRIFATKKAKRILKMSNTLSKLGTKWQGNKTHGTFSGQVRKSTGKGSSGGPRGSSGHEVKRVGSGSNERIGPNTRMSEDEWIQLDSSAVRDYLASKAIADKSEGQIDTLEPNARQDGILLSEIGDLKLKSIGDGETCDTPRQLSVTTGSGEGDVKAQMKLGALLTGMSGRGKRGLFYRTILNLGGAFDTGTAGSYYVNWNGTGAELLVNSVANTGEWGSFNGVFQEFFVHKMTVHYEPSNQNLQGYVNGTSTNVQTMGVALSSVQHSQAFPADTGTAYQTLMNSSQCKWTNTSRKWSFAWKNIEKFSKNGPVGDSTTSASSTSWMNMGNSAKYGGAIAAAFAFATNATPSSSALPVSAKLGIYIVRYDVSFRYRD